MIKEAKELINSNNLEDKKLGIILLSTLVSKEEFKEYVRSIQGSPINYKYPVVFYYDDWDTRIYVGDNRIRIGMANTYSEEKCKERNPGIEIIELYELTRK